VWANGRHMNISEFAPIVNGQTFHDYDIEWVVTQVLASGVWDGMFYDNLNGRINPFILNANDNSLLNYDANGNGLRDESPAWVSDKTRTAFIKYLQRIRDQVGDLEIIMGNAGPYPDIYLAPYVNGYVFEGWNAAWFAEWVSPPSEPEWRRSLDAYFTIQEETVWPHINIIQGSGMVWTGSIPNPDRKYLEPTPRDLEQHRFTLGTTLLGDGFYEYDLFTARSAPFWFDEFTVDENGVAIEDRRYKGYLGMALDDALELASPSTEIWSENFETGALPPEMWAQAGVYVSQLEDDIIDGVGTLVIDNPDHARGASIEAGTITDRIALGSDKTYVVEFDWKILETIDQSVHATLRAPSGQEIFWWWPGVVAGDAGKARFHATLAGSDDYSFVVQLLGGGGKIAIDNIRIVEGGAGPWRRDFEN